VSRRPLFDAVIVGAGVVGSAAALGLAREGLRVAIVEAHTPSAWRADRPDLRVYAFAPDSRAPRSDDRRRRHGSPLPACLE
jgi:2-octaprenyl-3-methyl-6-methoxy-1,4-benzoquinol hydroxylase